MIDTADLERARAYVQRYNQERALAGDDDDTAQLRAAVAAAETAVAALNAKREELAESGRYTPAGIAAAIEHDVAAALKSLEDVRTKYVAPRVSRLEAELAKLPQPRAPELDAMERHRLLETYARAGRDEKLRMLATAGQHRRLAAALAEEDPTVTGLSALMAQHLRKVAAEDGHAEQREALQRRLVAAEAAQAAIDDAVQRVRGTVED